MNSSKETPKIAKQIADYAISLVYFSTKLTALGLL
jgi:hypothetical protein